MINIRQKIRGLILDVVGTFSQPAIGIHILNGHHLGYSVKDARAFRKQLFLLSNKVQLINYNEAVRIIVNKIEVNKPLVAFSFDDGFEECYTDIAPVLEEFGVNAAFFINPNFIDGDKNYIDNFCKNIIKTPNKQPMSWSQLENLQRRGFIIGGHTLDHYNINDDNIVELERQIGDCKKVIESKLKSSCDYFAFPFGRLEHANKASIEIACKYYKYVFSQSDYKNYFSFNGKVINRRHFEPFWSIKHVKYFISCNKKWNSK